ncbi:SAM-dependent methyltransferase [Nocardia amamiensis]|uniref:SAM-dependent methyltransferase n=1 Tax=Nocardia amamiensis TaxID=404578 RepID=UPI0008334D2D|nr:SAM-dependent methyltransferase [Nocardia amamiensis]
MATNDFQGREVDAGKPTSARLYHYYLTGEPIYHSDQVFAEKVYDELPFLHTWALHNRAFLGRAVRFMVSQGIRQFLDIGSGLPTGGNTHEIARAIAPDARVVYVDKDLDAVARAHQLLRTEGSLDKTAIIEGDLHEPVHILEHPNAQRLLTSDEPVGLLIVSVLPFIPDDSNPHRLVAQLRDRLPVGSHFASTHVSLEDADVHTQQQVAAAASLYQATADPVQLRDRASFTRFFDGFTLYEPPGITYATDWLPDVPVDLDEPARRCNFAAVGRKP